MKREMVKTRRAKAGRIADNPMQKISVSPRDCAAMIGLSESGVRRLIASGDLPASLVGYRWLVMVDDIHDFLVSRRVCREDQAGGA